MGRRVNWSVLWTPLQPQTIAHNLVAWLGATLILPTATSERLVDCCKWEPFFMDTTEQTATTWKISSASQNSVENYRVVVKSRGLAGLKNWKFISTKNRVWYQNNRQYFKFFYTCLFQISLLKLFSKIPFFRKFSELDCQQSLFDNASKLVSFGLKKFLDSDWVCEVQLFTTSFCAKTLQKMVWNIKTNDSRVFKHRKARRTSKKIGQKLLFPLTLRKFSEKWDFGKQLKGNHLK